MQAARHDRAAGHAASRGLRRMATTISMPTIRRPDDEPAAAAPAHDAAAATMQRPRLQPPHRAVAKTEQAVDSRTMAGIRIVDVTDEAGFGLIPPCADPRFDHRTCDYWEDADHGSKAARSSWLERRPPGDRPPRATARPKPANPFLADLEAAAPPANPFATARPANPFLTPGDEDDGPVDNPFAPPPKARPTVGRRCASEAPAARPRASVWRGATRRSSCSTTNRPHTPSSVR